MTRNACTLMLCASAAWTSVAGDVDLPQLDRRYDQCAFLASHNSYANSEEGYAIENHRGSITDQLNYGVRTLNLDVWLVRQRQLPGGCKWEYKDYITDNTDAKGIFKNVPLELVVGHGNKHLIGAVRERCAPWKSYAAVLTDIRKWVEAHPNEVITLEVEEMVPPAEEDRIAAAHAASGLGDYFFQLNVANTGVPAPDRRPGGWIVGRYGFPTLQQLVNAGKTVVYYPLHLSEKFDYEVGSVYGAASFNARKWTDPRPESNPINDFTRWTFGFIHVPAMPDAPDSYVTKNSIGKLRQKEADMEAKWNRLPNHVWVDFYDLGASLAPNTPPGPALFVNELNGKWNSLPELTPLADISPGPSAYGWYNTNVDVRLSGSGGAIRAFTSIFFNSRSPTSGVLPGNSDSYHFVSEGVRTLCFSVVGDLGNRSPVKLIDIAIDKTPPTLIATLERPPDRNGYYTSNVTVRFECSDALSGISSCPGDVVVGPGTNQTVTGTAIDRADNRTTVSVTNITVIGDTQPPVICVLGEPDVLRTPKGKPVAIVIRGIITDHGSGVDAASPAYELQDDCRRALREGRIVIAKSGAFKSTIRLDTKQSGHNHDDREYFVVISAADQVGNVGETRVKVDTSRRHHGSH